MVDVTGATKKEIMFKELGVSFLLKIARNRNKNFEEAYLPTILWITN